jgi:outer membrane protein
LHSENSKINSLNIVKNIFLFVVIALSSAQSQEVFTLDRCLMLARERSPRLRSAENAIRVAELSHTELSTTKLPQVRFSASSIYAPSSGRLSYDPALSDGGHLAGQVIVQQSLYDGGIRGLKSDQITFDLDRLSKEHQIAERDLIFSIKQAFIETLRSEKEIALEEESVHQLSDYLDLVRRLSKGGSGAYTDVLKSELQLSQAQLSYQKATEEFAIAKYSLAELIGTPLDETFTISGSLDDSTHTENIVPLFIEPSDSISNLELSIASLAIKHSLVDVELTEHEKYPTVALIGDMGLLTSGDNLRLSRDARAGIFGYSFGIEFEIPLINWGATGLRAQQRQLDADNVRMQTELLQRSIQSEYRKVRLQIGKQRERLHVIQINLKSAEDNFLLTKSKYAGGGTLSLEVLSAQQLLTDTKLSELQTLADIHVLAARFEQLITR